MGGGTVGDHQRVTRPGGNVRRLLLTVTALAVIVVVLLGAGGWYYSDQLLPAPVASGPEHTVVVMEATADTVTLQTTDATPAWSREDLTSDLVLGFASDAGYLRLTGLEEVVDSDTARWAFEVMTGAAPSVGDLGDLQAYAYPDEPVASLGPVDEAAVPGPLGTLPAWRFDGDGDTWVVFVHGRGGTRTEGFRAMEVVRDLGLPALVVSIRNDPGAPPSPDGYGRFGAAEWEDLQAAVDWLQSTEHAERFVLFGSSQGGGISAAFLRRSPDADRVVGAVLDSPLLSIHETLELQAAGRGIPGPVVGPLLFATKAITDLRSGLDFAALEHVADADELDVPLLVFHGREDSTVPFEPSARLAEVHDDIRFVPYDGEHVRAWNVDPAAYAAEVRAFLEDVLR